LTFKLEESLCYGTQPFVKYFPFFQEDLICVITSKERAKEGTRSVKSNNGKKMFAKKEKIYK